MKILPNTKITPKTLNFLTWQTFAKSSHSGGSLSSWYEFCLNIIYALKRQKRVWNIVTCHVCTTKLLGTFYKYDNLSLGNIHNPSTPEVVRAGVVRLRLGKFMLELIAAEQRMENLILIAFLENLITDFVVLFFMMAQTVYLLHCSHPMSSPGTPVLSLFD